MTDIFQRAFHVFCFYLFCLEEKIGPNNFCKLLSSNEEYFIITEDSMYASVCKLALFFSLVVKLKWKKCISEVLEHTCSWQMQDLSWSTGNSVQA